MSVPNCATCDNNMSMNVNRVTRTQYESNPYQTQQVHNKAIQNQNSYQERINMILKQKTAQAQTINNSNSPQVKHIFR